MTGFDTVPSDRAAIVATVDPDAATAAAYTSDWSAARQGERSSLELERHGAPIGVGPRHGSFSERPDAYLAIAMRPVPRKLRPSGDIPMIRYT